MPSHTWPWERRGSLASRKHEHPVVSLENKGEASDLRTGNKQLSTAQSLTEGKVCPAIGCVLADDAPTSARKRPIQVSLLPLLPFLSNTRKSSFLSWGGGGGGRCHLIKKKFF